MQKLKRSSKLQAIALHQTSPRTSHRLTQFLSDHRIVAQRGFELVSSIFGALVVQWFKDSSWMRGKSKFEDGSRFGEIIGLDAGEKLEIM